MGKFFQTSLFAIVALFLLLSGCQTADDYRRERVQKADESFKKLKEREIPQGTVLTLPECLSIALENNLDMKVYDLKAAVDKEQKTAAMLGMLPDLIVNNNLSYRNNSPASTAVNSKTGKETDIAFFSQEQTQNTFNVDLAFSVIDFGLAYFNSVQSQDRRLITDEETRRAAQNLVLDVTSAYFTVATAQYEMEKMEALIEQCDITDNDIEEIKKTKSIPLFSALYQQEQLLELKRDLRNYKRYYDTAWIQLKALMGYHPLSEVKVDTSVIGRVPNVLLPDIDVLESIALLERPELYQLDIQKHLTVVEARKTILMMFPNVRAFADFTNSSNPYMINRTWMEIGVRAAYNLLKLPQQYAQYRSLDKQADQVDAQALALSVGILAQVRIAYCDLAEAQERYLLQERIFKAYSEHLTEAEKNFRISGGMSELEVKRLMMEEGKAGLERSVELMRYYTSYYRVLNSVGLQSLDKEKLEELKIRITEATKDAAEDEKEKIAEFEEDINKLKIEAAELSAMKTESAEEKLKKINEEITQLSQKSSESKEIIDSTDRNLKKYDAFIETLKNPQPSNVPAPFIPQKPYTSQENLNTQMQLQTPDNTVYEEGYAPRSAQDLSIQTQEEAGNNTIGTDEFKNTPSTSLNNQMLWDTDRNLINAPEMTP